MLKIFIDVETGGTDSKVNPLLQLSGIIDHDGKICGEFDFKIKPFKGQVAKKEALEVNKLTVDEILTFHEPLGVFDGLKYLLNGKIDKFDKADKAFFVGYNSRFDEEFLRQFFINCADNEKDKQYGNGFGFLFSLSK